MHRYHRLASPTQDSVTPSHTRIGAGLVESGRERAGPPDNNHTSTPQRLLYRGLLCKLMALGQPCIQVARGQTRGGHSFGDVVVAAPARRGDRSCPQHSLSGARSAIAVVGLPATKQSVDTSWFRLLVHPAAIAVTHAPWWWEAATRKGCSGSLGVVALVPVLALAGWWNVRRDPRGRRMHDRPLDLIQGLLLAIVVDRTALLARDGRVWRRMAYEILECWGWNHRQ